MNFLLRLLFPKTAQLEDQRAEIVEIRLQNVKLVDAIVRARGEAPVFGQLHATQEPPPKRIGSPFDSEYKAWRENAILQEDERIIQRAMADEDGYDELLAMAEENAPRAKELLETVNRRLNLLDAETEGGVS